MLDSKVTSEQWEKTLKTKTVRCLILQLHLDHCFLVTMLYVVDHRRGTAKEAWLSSQTETDATDDG